MNVAHFLELKSYEHVQYVLRRHWFTFLPKIVLFLVLIAIPLLVHAMIANIYPQIFEGDIAFTLSILLMSCYYLGIILFFYTQFIVFYLDMWVVTNDRIVDIEQIGLFSRTISELDLFRIQDVTSDVHGFFATLLKYGVVTIKTASNNIHIVFKDVSHPDLIREQLIRLSHEDRKYHYTVAIADES